MKWSIFSLIALLLFTPGCESRTKKEELQKKEIALNKKEHDLLLREKSLQLKEQQLQQREKQIDSSPKVDTTNLYNPALIGRWSVKMTCTETTCTGSAVGDTKNEQWAISYQGKTIIAKVIVADKLVRIYTGFFTDNSVELMEDSERISSRMAPKMVVRLQIVNEKTLDGHREIVRDNNCKVLYALQLKKQD
ncbi:hypothetical protein [Spirosoma spitsbergense]|uniref:hypothetical protein n=1 Tax=Spirosoma spitsbergense TaxID=431554 RepID=UPI000381B9E9|nr:hypothetical protein [Spirosoma spitsbergense]